jgi:hypothetical protein
MHAEIVGELEPIQQRGNLGLVDVPQTPNPKPQTSFKTPNLLLRAQVTELRLDMHAELVGELSTNSSKEMAIEQSLASIAATWTDLNLDMVPYKETHKGVYKLRGTEDVFAALEVGRNLHAGKIGFRGEFENPQADSFPEFISYPDGTL